MDIMTRVQALQHASTLQTVQSRLLIASAALLGAADGRTETVPDLLRHLAVELRAIAVSMDVLLPHEPEPTTPDRRG
jgi:hypothetical protein